MTRANHTAAPALDDTSPGRLASLRVPAPAGLADDALVEVGLVDRMASVPSPIGTPSRPASAAPWPESTRSSSTG